MAAGVVVALASPAIAASSIQIPSAYAYGGISENGVHVVFTTSSKLVAADTNTRTDLYTLDQTTGSTRLVSSNAVGQAVGVGSDTTQAFGGTRLISDDGRYAVFSSYAAVVPAAPAGPEHVYRKDLTTGAVTLLDQHPTSGPSAKGVYEIGGITALGDKVAYRTPAPLVSTDTNTYNDAYLWTASTGSNTLISASATGAALGTVNDIRLAAGGGSAIYTRLAAPPAVGWNLYRRNLATGATETLANEVQLGEFALSANGSTVAFQTNKSLIASDTGGKDVYVLTSTGEIKWMTAPAAGFTQPTTAVYALGNFSSDGQYLSLGSNRKLATGASSNQSAFSGYRVTVASGAAQTIAPSASITSTLASSNAMSGSGTKLVVDGPSWSVWRVSL